jgi:uncharacterized protein
MRSGQRAERGLDNERVYRWRGLQSPSLEVLRLEILADRIQVRSEIDVAGVTPFAVSYEWVLDLAWRTRALHLRLRGGEDRELSIERTGDVRWRVDGRERDDLQGCEEIDLSVTPFCNTLALRRFGPPPGGAGELTPLYVGLPELSLAPSRQRYEQLGPSEFVYIDLGAYAGFRARLTVDPDGVVRDYENLFERVGEAV